MILDIVDNGTIEVFGATNKQALENAKQIQKIIGNDRWLSFSGMLYGSSSDVMRKYKRVVKFKS